jgi:hypothetical protein
VIRSKGTLRQTTCQTLARFAGQVLTSLISESSSVIQETYYSTAGLLEGRKYLSQLLVQGRSLLAISLLPLLFLYNSVLGTSSPDNTYEAIEAASWVPQPPFSSSSEEQAPTILWE